MHNIAEWRSPASRWPHKPEFGGSNPPSAIKKIRRYFEMKVLKPHIAIMEAEDYAKMKRKVELAGRTCYKSEENITEESADKLILSLLKRGHESVLEHASVTVRVICDRGVTHEIVRHRIASYSQESTRYCNYSKDKFGGEITFIEPCFLEVGTKGYELWEKSCKESEKTYFEMIDYGMTPQEARSVLPNSLKTEIVMTLNMRSWRNFFKLRCAKDAHPQMREVANMIFECFKLNYPVFVSDLERE